MCLAYGASADVNTIAWNIQRKDALELTADAVTFGAQSAGGTSPYNVAVAGDPVYVILDSPGPFLDGNGVINLTIAYVLVSVP